MILPLHTIMKTKSNGMNEVIFGVFKYLTFYYDENGDGVN